MNPSPAGISGDAIESARGLRHHLLADPYRPGYHFVVPEDFARPAAPNGALFWNGRYHLHYIYQDNGVHFWGHISSLDLLHWRQGRYGCGSPGTWRGLRAGSQGLER